MSNIASAALNFASSLIGATQKKATTNAAQTKVTNNAAKPTSPTASADANTFMTLLVAQLKNQDPLNPQDGAQFVAQLAQFNSLDQLIQINQQLSALVAGQPKKG